jgi:hypothetical protein
MNVMDTDTWTRRGISLLWDETAFSRLARPDQVLSMRAACQLSRGWKDELPANGGKTLAVAGLDVCLDVLAPSDAEGWIADVLKPLMWSFQAEYDGEGALVLWIPGGRRRVFMNPATERYFWRCAAPYTKTSLEIGRLLMAGAEQDAVRLMTPGAGSHDPDGPEWIGLHHPRIS